MILQISILTDEIHNGDYKIEVISDKDPREVMNALYKATDLIHKELDPGSEAQNDLFKSE